MIEDSYDAIHQHSNNLELRRDLSILFLSAKDRKCEAASFQVLQLAAAKMENARMMQLLRENFDESKDDRALFMLIMTKYL